jgi:trans-2-enoyl-CoA reductase
MHEVSVLAQSNTVRSAFEIVSDPEKLLIVGSMNSFGQLETEHFPAIE